MKISINWLEELINSKVSVEEIIRLLPLRTIGIKDVTDDFIELDMKGYNRADLLSLRGIAYEVAAITDSKVTFAEPNPESFTWNGKNLPEASVKVENPELAPLYCIAEISGLKVGASPADWVKKLADSGIRAVNNIADITNLVMLEYGQPSHAFDAATIKDQALIVRTAKEGENLITLDGKTRKLLSSDLLITDPEKAVGLAGVMGGKNSEVTEKTAEILLEVAIFDPKTIRKTATRLGLPSEAGTRFQHGLTGTRAFQALNALIRTYQQLGGKLEAISIVDNLEEKTKTVTLTQKKVNSLIGIDIPPAEVESSLTKLDFKLASHSSTPIKSGSSGNVVWDVTVPYFRLDINIEEDLIEEVARMYGYEKIPPQELQGKLPEKIDQSLFDLIYNLRLKFVELGLTEVQTYSFYSTQVINELRMTTNDLIKIANPISSETEYLRDEIWPNLLEKAAENLKYFKEVAIFEVGKAYQAKPELKEGYRLSILLSDDSGDPTPELYQIFQETMSHLPGEKLQLHLEGEAEEREFFHPTRFAALEKDGKEIGFIAEIHPRIANKFGIEKRVAVLEIKIPDRQ
ncbi:phenylalanine--tRNA ligase subunit beta [Candidatus Daviesbacteria bacterium]|nr:phenylalanine--tRNA ligase subunit beta [Candidatus Daviesbacteria bacterium]